MIQLLIELFLLFFSFYFDSIYFTPLHFPLLFRIVGKRETFINFSLTRQIVYVPITQSSGQQKNRNATLPLRKLRGLPPTRLSL